MPYINVVSNPSYGSIEFPILEKAEAEVEFAQLRDSRLNDKEDRVTMYNLVPIKAAIVSHVVEEINYSG